VAADPIMFAIFCEAIAKYSLDTAACIMTSVFTATNISVHGTAAQKTKYLPPFLRGERTFSIAMTEPQSGSDAAAARTKATLEGDEWVVNGNKTFCSGAHIPGTTIVLLARTGEERYKGLSLFILPNDAPGLTITKLNTIVRRSLGTTQLYLDNVRLPKENLLGEIGEGWKYIGEHLEHERLSLAASYVGNANTALDDTMRYTKDRKAFGKSISEFQVMKHRMVDGAIALEAARLLGCTTAQVQADRLRAAQLLASQYRCVVVLKGAGTVLAAPLQTPCINASGNAKLATAGTGDVLAGIVGAQVADSHANGQTPFEAACAAVSRHGQVADAWQATPTLTASALAQRI
jgi:alkylation response protein AidB-like acyl-CoA dehydrogenase